MTLTDTEYDEIVAYLYAAGSGRLDWQAALSLLADRLALWAVVVMGLSRADQTVLFAYQGGRASAEVALDYVRTYHRINPRVAPTLALEPQPGQWVHCHELFDEAFVARDPYYQDFLIPRGGRYASSAKLTEDARYVVLLSVGRGPDQRPLAADEIALLDRLRGHLAESVRIHLALRDRMLPQAAIGREILDRMRQPMVLTDAQLRILYRNPAGQRFLDRSPAFGEHNDRLFCRNRDDDARLRQAIRQLELEHDPPTGAPPARTVTRINGTGLVHPKLVLAMALRPAAQERDFGQKPLALLLLHATTSRRQIDPSLLAEVFQLTPAEAHVATGLAEGHSVSEIADARGVTIETVRAQIRAVYGKTGVRSRTDLVRMLLEMPMFETPDSADFGARQGA